LKLLNTTPTTAIGPEHMPQRPYGQAVLLGVSIRDEKAIVLPQMV
jgi:hypothetical protein